MRFLLRDFGAPYLSVGALDEWPADAVLLDASVGGGLLAEGRRLALAEALMSLSREQGFEMVADGVENRRIAEALYANGCAYMTGAFAGRWVRERSIRA